MLLVDLARPRTALQTTLLNNLLIVNAAAEPKIKRNIENLLEYNN